MNSSTRTKILLVGLAIGLVSGSASSGVNDKLQEMFGSANATMPGYVDSASRGVITGGNLSIRSPIVQPGGFAFDPPNISAGCGGIDLYGGNLSFPSKEQYIASARAIAMNIGGYAFKSSLKQICDVCESVMSQIQDTVNELNMDNMNSCQIAQGIVDGDKTAAVQSRARNLAAIWSKDTGESKDINEAYNAGSNNSPSKSARQDPGMRKLLEGNWTWQSINDTGAFDWLGTDKATREELMSLLGTVITCTRGENGCSAPSGSDPTPVVLAPQLKLQDFIALDAEASEVRMYACGSDDECLNPSQTARRRLGKSAAQRVVDILLGTPESPGVLKRMVMPGENASPWTPEERALMANTTQVTERAVMCIKSGENGEGYARTIVEGYSQLIAAEMMYQTTQQSLTYLIQDLTNRAGAIGTEAATQMLKESRVQLEQQMGEIRQKTQTNDALAQAIERCAVKPLAQATYGGVR